jgi:hypothetical protein
MSAKETPSKTDAKYVSVIVDSVERIGPSNVVFKLSLLNNTGKCIRLSNFSLETDVSSAVFYDKEGQVWGIPESKLVRDAASTKVDYATLIQSGQTTNVMFLFEDILPMKGKSPANAKARPRIHLTYLMFSNVSATSCDFRQPFWVIVGGRGTVELNRDAK